MSKVMIKIRTTYQVVTEESASEGEYARQGWYHQGHQYSADVTPAEYEAIAESFDSTKEAIDYLRDKGCLEPSSSQYFNGIWYSTVDPDKDYESGEDTYYSFHIDASNYVQRKIFNVLNKRS